MENEVVQHSVASCPFGAGQTIAAHADGDSPPERGSPHVTDPGLNAYLTPLSPKNPLAGMRIVRHFQTRKPKLRKVNDLSIGIQFGRDGLGLGPDWPPKATLLAPAAAPEEAEPFHTL